MQLSPRWFYQFVLMAILLAWPLRVFCIEPPLSQKALEKLSPHAMIAEILNVQITSTSTYSEVGTVEVKPLQFLAGTISVPTLVFPFQRSLAFSDSPANWDNIAPVGASLTTQVGEQLLIYFTDDKGTYSLFPASNAVQNINKGILLGKIKSVQHDMSSSGHRHPITVTIEVSETIFGWVAGTIITLPLENLKQEADYVAPSASGTNLATGNTPGRLADFCVESRGRQVVIYFNNGEIRGVKTADKKLLQEIITLDSQGG